jgi:hypothetical protein
MARCLLPNQADLVAGPHQGEPLGGESVTVKMLAATGAAISPPRKPEIFVAERYRRKSGMASVTLREDHVASSIAIPIDANDVTR